MNDFLTMNDIRHFKKKDSYDCRLDMSNHQEAVPKTKLFAGSVADKYPVLLDDGRTVVSELLTLCIKNKYFPAQ